MQVVEIEKPEPLDAEAAAKKKKNKKKKGKGGGGAGGDAPPDEDEEQPAAKEAAEEISIAASAPAPAPADEQVTDDGSTAESSAAAKKKKKKKGGGGGGGGGGSGGGSDGGASGATTLPPAEDGSARFQSALDALKSADSAASMTTSDLSQCGFGDKKLRQLLAALRGLGASCVLTSLDLSHNAISDAGATALCAALGAEENVAPQLASLSLNANALSEAAASQCAVALATRPALALVLPERARPGGALPAAEDARAPVLDQYFEGRTAESEAAVAAEAGGGDDDERPLLIGPQLSAEAAAAILEGGDPASAGASVAVCDALQSLLLRAEAEVAQLGASGSSNAKFLPRSLKWCSQHVGLLGALLAPPAKPRVSYGTAADDGDDSFSAIPRRPFGDRLGRRRLLVIELLTCLIGARRPPLTTALAEAKPSLVCVAATLLRRHPSSAVLGSAVRRLVDVALLAKPMRASVLSSSAAELSPTSGDFVTSGIVPSLQFLVAEGLSAVGGRPNRNLLPAAPVWLELASALETLGSSDKQVAERLAACKEWAQLASTGLPAVRASAPPARWACGDPPAKEGASVIGAGSEMGELLRLLQLNKK